MYLFPRLEVTGKAPVWSVYMVSWALKIKRYTSLFLGKGALFVSCGNACSLSAFVDLTFVHCNFICPLSVSLVSGWYLLTFLVIRDCHVTKIPFFIAASHVVLVGYVSHSCMQETNGHWNGW